MGQDVQKGPDFSLMKVGAGKAGDCTLWPSPEAGPLKDEKEVGGSTQPPEKALENGTQRKWLST